MPLLGVSPRHELPVEEFPEPFDEVRNSLEAPPEPSAQFPPDGAADSPPEDKSDTNTKPIEERFRSLEVIPLADIIPFPTGLPALLKAA